jgi:hypothetical protein
VRWGLCEPAKGYHALGALPQNLHNLNLLTGTLFDEVRAIAGHVSFLYAFVVLL